VSTASRSLVIGTYTRSLWPVHRRPAGILGASLEETGQASQSGQTGLTGLNVLAKPPNPSWLTATADGRYLYAVSETRQFAGVTAYARDPATGALTPLNTVSSGGTEPAHLGLDPSERFVVVANYGSGSVAVFAREAGGTLGAMTGHVQHQGSSADPDRQASPHPHQVCFDPVTGDLLVTDLGMDAVLSYRLGDDGGLTERRTARITGAPGAGTRHLAFHPDGQHLFVVNELDSTLAGYVRDGATFARTGAVSTVPDGFTGPNYPSAVRVSASGRSVLAANRGHDSIALFAFDPPTGKLTPALVVPAGGRWPRDFVLTPDGARLLVACQRGGTVSLFDFNEQKPSLRPVSAIGVRAPACLCFLPY
jgi:6-phosphogluconolactonase